MAANTFGNIFRLTTYGESHGIAIGGIIDGCPPNIELDFEEIQYQLNRRKPGQSKITTQRLEDDKVEFLSGVFEGKTTGTPIAFEIRNKDQRSKDYGKIKDVYRPSHADYTYSKKYGVQDYRGGGRSSARETIARVVGGTIARQVLAALDITITAYTSQVGEMIMDTPYNKLDFSTIENNIIRCPDAKMANEMIDYVDKIRLDGDSVGGTISCVIKNVPVGLGEPVFDKLHAELGKAMLSINAVKGFEYGSGFNAAKMKGSEHNDIFKVVDGEVTTLTNNSGGIQGGISNGEDIYFKTVFKPVATIMKEVETIDKDGNETVLHPKGRHDPCVLPRAVPIVEAMAALVIVDAYLKSKTVR